MKILSMTETSYSTFLLEYLLNRMYFACIIATFMTVTVFFCVYVCLHLKTNIFLFLGIYLEAIDSYGHKYGVNSPQLNQMLLDVDKTLQDFRQNLTSNGLDDDVNIIVFSDHGMTNLSQIVNITDALNMSDIKVIFQEPPYVTIWPEEGQLEKVCI